MTIDEIMTSMEIENIWVRKGLTLKDLAELGIVIIEHDAGQTEYSCGEIGKRHADSTPAGQPKKDR